MRMPFASAILLCLGAGTAAADAPHAIASYKLGSGAFIDDPFALRNDGKAIAYLSTDGASASQLHLAEVPAGKPEVVIPGVAVATTALYWLGPDRVLAVARDPDKQIATGQVYTSKGPTREKLGPVEDIALGAVDGKLAVVTFARHEKGGTAELAIAAYARETGKPLGKRLFKEDAEGRIAAPGGPYKVLWWRDGYTAAATLKAGEFDKSRDMRRPDRFARLDVFHGKITEETEIEDVIGFAQAGLEHKKHNNESAFIHLSEDHKKLLLTDGLEEHELTLARPLFMYDNTTLGQQLLADGRLAVSATVDPTNPPAVQRKKADPDDFDLFYVDRKSRAVRKVLELPGEGRPTSWRIAGGRLALLRKSKGFDRGGVLLEIYDLP